MATSIFFISLASDSISCWRVAMAVSCWRDAGSLHACGRCRVIARRGSRIASRSFVGGRLEDGAAESDSSGSPSSDSGTKKRAGRSRLFFVREAAARVRRDKTELQTLFADAHHRLVALLPVTLDLVAGNAACHRATDRGQVLALATADLVPDQSARHRTDHGAGHTMRILDVPRPVDGLV